MRYKNTKTGAIVDSPFKIHGKHWVVVNPEETNGEVNETVENEEYVDEEIDLEEMTKKELIELAKEHEIDINEKDTKPVIIEAIVKAFE